MNPIPHRAGRAAAVSILLSAAMVAPCPASELVYVPTNPVFGGTPLNGSAFLSAAQMTNKHKDPSTTGRQNALQQFTDMLERRPDDHHHRQDHRGRDLVPDRRPVMARLATRMLPAAALIATALLAGCITHPSPARSGAQLTPATDMTRELARLPAPKGKVAVAVYGFRDQSGQYKPAPDSSFSTAVTQGASAILIKALLDSGWFIPVERENLQNLLTERKIVRALESPDRAAAAGAAQPGPPGVPQLMPASLIVESGIIAYESNVRTSGIGANYLGVGLSTLYRVDQVTINLRTVDIRNGKLLASVSTTKAIYSYEVRPTVFKFVNFKDLVQFEAGMTRNEPAQLCVREAIEAAVVHLVAQGVRDGHWDLKDAQDRHNPLRGAAGSVRHRQRRAYRAERDRPACTRRTIRHRQPRRPGAGPHRPERHAAPGRRAQCRDPDPVLSRSPAT